MSGPPPPPSQHVVSVFENIARHACRPLTAGAAVLDFGAGAGRHVAEFRAAGYEAVGVDTDFTSHEVGSVSEDYLYKVRPPDFRLPFSDDSFDLVYSTVVMEHVTDPAGALPEIARVLRPEGLSVHCFPSRWRPVEPHMRTPFGGRFDSFAVLSLWARLGIRGPGQHGLAPTQVALDNARFVKVGLSYPSAREWRLRSSASFADVGWAEGPYIEATRDRSRVSWLVAPLLAVPWTERLYRTFHTRVLVLQRPL